MGYSRRNIMEIIGCGPTIRHWLELTGEPPDQAKIEYPSKKTPEIGDFIIQQTTVDPYISGKELSLLISDSSKHKFLMQQ